MHAQIHNLCILLLKDSINNLTPLPDPKKMFIMLGGVSLTNKFKTIGDKFFDSKTCPDTFIRHLPMIRGLKISENYWSLYEY